MNSVSLDFFKITLKNYKHSKTNNNEIDLYTNMK